MYRLPDNPTAQDLVNHCLLDKETGCWEWQGWKDENGYGRVLRTHAHRLVWQLLNGGLTKEQHVLHRCDNPPCCNPDHLWVGSHAENIADAARKGRLDKKLSADQVREIRSIYLSGCVLQREIAAEFGVAQATVSKIVLGQRRHHVT